MNRRSLPCSNLRLAKRTRHGAFTLIELLTVIAIILVLAALLLHVAGSAQYNAAKARATAEIQQISTACENYKVDNGTYPRAVPTGTTACTTPPSDGLNANTPTPVDPSSTPVLLSSTALFQQLSGTQFPPPASPSPSPKAYITFLPSQLSTGNVTPTGATYLIDPFGLSYGYSTAYQAAVDAANAGTPVSGATPGYNPTFDIWSTAGYAANGGRAYPTPTPVGGDNTIWVKNW